VKLIVFGIGNVYKIYHEKIIKKNIIAYSDNYINVDTFEQKPLIVPAKIKEWDFDYIVIFTTNYFGQIYKQLVNELGIQEQKIISFLDVIDNGKQMSLQKCGEYAIRIIEKMKWLRVLDTSAFLSGLYYTREPLNKTLGHNIRIDSLICRESKLYTIYNNLYSKIYNNQEDILSVYDVILIINMLKESKLEYGIKELKTLILKSRYIYVVLPYYSDGMGSFTNSIDLQSMGEIIYSEYEEFGKCLIIDTEYRLLNVKVKIYTVGHKAFEAPDYSLYKSIYVGEYGRKFEFAQSDSRGRNIAEYNEAINEITALYWIWKNAEEDYVGLCHYRRYFCQGRTSDTEEILQEPFINAILEEYDIILPQVNVLLPNTKEQLEKSVDVKVFGEGWKIITQLIKERQPEYWDAFEYIFNGIKIYPCNMFISKKKTIDRYCEWLFSFILDAADAMDISRYDEYSRRIIGFFSERLFNVWLVKQELIIKELPILLLD